MRTWKHLTIKHPTTIMCSTCRTGSLPSPVMSTPQMPSSTTIPTPSSSKVPPSADSPAFHPQLSARLFSSHVRSASPAPSSVSVSPASTFSGSAAPPTLPFGSHSSHPTTDIPGGAFPHATPIPTAGSALLSLPVSTVMNASPTSSSAIVHNLHLLFHTPHLNSKSNV